MEPRNALSTNKLTRVVLVWLTALTALLLISLALNAVLVQAANDPPVQVVTGQTDDLEGRFSQNSWIAAPLMIDSTTAVTLARATVNLSSNHTHTCLATASAEIFRTNDAHALLQFTLTMDSTNGIDNKPAHRRVEFFPYAQDDESYEEVSTVAGFDNLTGSHTFYFLGRKNSDTYGPAGAHAAGITVACFKK